VDLKISVEELWNYLERDQHIFDEVTEPKLVHWDCWDGNIFVENGAITGFIDWERNIWADPLMEVGFRTYSDNTFFQKGYGLEILTSTQTRRALWYDIYLMILVSLEYEYRKYDTMDLYNWSTDVLTKQFEKLRKSE
jgi:aminoglycoside phosphotransferase (APT) family kinase protein